MNGLTRDDKHVYRWNDGDPLPSVTTILSIVDKSGPLVGWAKREVSNAAIRHLSTLQTMVETAGADSAARWLGTIPGYQRDTAADVGTQVHALAEALSKGQTVDVPADLGPYIVAYQRFLADWRPTYLAAEEMVCSLPYRYAGTLDAIMEIRRETWLIDLKTSKGVYPETALQLAAYAHAGFIGRAGTSRRFRIPPINRFGVLHLRPEGYQLVPFAVTRDTFRVFLHALALYRWREEEGKTIVGHPLDAKEEAAA